MSINDRIKKHNAKATGWTEPAGRPRAAAAKVLSPATEYKMVRGHINRGKVARMVREGWEVVAVTGVFASSRCRITLKRNRA